MPLSDMPIEPKGELMHRIEFEIMPSLDQDEPYNAVRFYKEFEDDCDTAEGKYKYFRLNIESIASKVQYDVHHKPSIELSDKVNGKCYVLCVFNDPAILDKVKPGEQVTIRGNYLAASITYGIIIKNSEKL